uniref:AlNc14C2G309 protein n=1 Tax=Albugo laibachii Nc14 TaxID=890382 RepID=F0VZH1_9STRA|nr:AlNc14C2G309 [Albugo laibachii Nc14]|eukprot:CCA14201.1 AlNc14C2G309 [Albugo laibachii Nc14]
MMHSTEDAYRQLKCQRVQVCTTTERPIITGAKGRGESSTTVLGSNILSVQVVKLYHPYFDYLSLHATIELTASAHSLNSINFVELNYYASCYSGPFPQVLKRPVPVMTG